jgi:hypothetical protein
MSPGFLQKLSLAIGIHKPRDGRSHYSVMWKTLGVGPGSCLPKTQRAWAGLRSSSLRSSSLGSSSLGSSASFNGLLELRNKLIPVVDLLF